MSSAEVPARRTNRVYELTKFDNETFAKALEDGAIHAKMGRREVLGAGERRQQIEIPEPKTVVTEFRQMGVPGLTPLKAVFPIRQSARRARFFYLRDTSPS
jgi:hypothetical protein